MAGTVGCQKDIAQLINKKEAYYVLALKGNQGSLHDHVQDPFVLEKNNTCKALRHRYHSEYDNGHGRIEHRECWVPQEID